MKKGFTLVEVLITLGIIGVVAALTIPNLIHNYQEKQLVTKLKKDYAIVNQALRLSIAQYGAPEDWEVSEYSLGDENDTKKEFLNTELLVRAMHVERDCGNEAKGCFTSDYKTLKGGKERDFENLEYYRKVVLPDGALLAIQGYGPLNEQTKGEIWIDVNGNRKPNVIGKDTFLFLIRPEVIEPYHIDEMKKGNSMDTCKTTSSGYSCAGWVLEFENQDYLRCNDLSWTDKHSCKK